MTRDYELFQEVYRQEFRNHKKHHTKRMLGSQEKGIVFEKYSAAFKGAEFDSSAAVPADEYIITNQS